jgi:hypothetical protein
MALPRSHSIWRGQDGSTFRIDARLTGANVWFAKVRLEQQPVRFQPDLTDERQAKRFRFMPDDEGGANIQRRTLCSRFLPEATIEPRLTECGRLKALGKVDPPRRLPHLFFRRHDD